VGELAERLVPDAGLDGQGERQVAVDGTLVASVSIGDGWRVGVRWRERTARSAQNSGDAARQVKNAVKEVGTALAGERRRLEELLAEERSWDVADWHPARAGTAQVGRWRDYLVAAGRAQPFKQAFREVYLITPAELETRLYSNRFAAHVPIPVGFTRCSRSAAGRRTTSARTAGLRGGPARRGRQDQRSDDHVAAGGSLTLARPGNRAIEAVNVCRKFCPPTGPSSPAQKNPATGMSPSMFAMSPVSWSG
jgi:Domain of unknown function (DUF4132)